MSEEEKIRQLCAVLQTNVEQLKEFDAKFQEAQQMIHDLQTKIVELHREIARIREAPESLVKTDDALKELISEMSDLVLPIWMYPSIKKRAKESLEI